MNSLKKSLWYSDDEVKDFHPHVENVLQNVLNNLGINDTYEIEHHPRIIGSSTEPDYGIRNKDNKQYIFIVEVKKTVPDVESERTWVQTKNYIDALSQEWERGVPQYFLITNIERSLSFANRHGHVANCILVDNPQDNGIFIKNDIPNFEDILESFEQHLTEVVKMAIEAEQPQFANNWKIIVGAFRQTYKQLVRKVSISDSRQQRDVTLYELIRMLFYYYLQNKYQLEHHTNSSSFKHVGKNFDSISNLKNHLENNYKRVLRLDFQQIFEGLPYDESIYDYLDQDSLGILVDFIDSLDRYMRASIKESTDPSIFFNQIIDYIYDREELHSEGKVMTDYALANILAELTISNPEDEVLDPGSGDGSFLEAAYNKLYLLKKDSDLSPNHNSILSQIHGYEVDTFLNQLSSFRLLAKNINSIDRKTNIDIRNQDIFSETREKQFDVVLMNPPYLRNDNSKYPITEERKKLMISSINKVTNTCIVEGPKQPNLYYYFVNYLPHYLKTSGVAGIVLMRKFLNNQDGSYLKEFLLPYLDSIIIYPKDFFFEYKVTTCIVLIKKNPSSEEVNFLNIQDPKLLDSPNEIKTILASENDEVGAQYSIRKIARKNLDPETNWLLPLIDPQEHISVVDKNPLLKPLFPDLFKGLKRGSADNSGGSKVIFLHKNSRLKDYYRYLGKEHITVGLKNNKLPGIHRRQFILNEKNLKGQVAVRFPPDILDFEKRESSKKYGQFIEFFHAGEKVFSKKKWKKIVNNTLNSTVAPDLIIPRADRTKHAVYMLSDKQSLVLSTNFCYLTDFSHSNRDDIMVVLAYLISSFGQIQFEVHSNNHEGLRKMEKFMIKKIKSIDPSLLRGSEKEEILTEFKRFNELDIDIRGDEGVNSARYPLDKVIASVLLKYDQNLPFDDPNDLAEFGALFCQELVSYRISSSA